MSRMARKVLKADLQFLIQGYITAWSLKAKRNARQNVVGGNSYYRTSGMKNFIVEGATRTPFYLAYQVYPRIYFW